jgi:hypothetical protein
MLHTPCAVRDQHHDVCGACLTPLNTHQPGALPRWPPAPRPAAPRRPRPPPARAAWPGCAATAAPPPLTGAARCWRPAPPARACGPPPHAAGQQPRPPLPPAAGPTPCPLPPAPAAAPLQAQQRPPPAVWLPQQRPALPTAAPPASGGVGVDVGVVMVEGGQAGLNTKKSASTRRPLQRCWQRAWPPTLSVPWRRPHLFLLGQLARAPVCLLLVAVEAGHLQRTAAHARACTRV